MRMICDNGSKRNMNPEEESYFSMHPSNFPTEDELKKILKQPEVQKNLELEGMANITNFCVQRR